MNYHYPIDETWTKEEVIDVVHFFTLIEKAYEQQVTREKLLNAYNQFKHIVPSKSEEKRMFAQFEDASTYSSYPVVKRARETNGHIVKMRK